MIFRKLSEVAPPKASHIKPAPNDVVWHLTLDQIDSGAGRIDRRVYGVASEAGSSTFAFDRGNVLYSKLRPYLNKVICPDTHGIATTELVPLRPNPSELNREYLCFYLRSPEFLSWARTQVDGAKMPRMKMTSFWAHEIPVPPLSDQISIAHLLGKVEGLITKRKEHLQQLDALLRSAFLEIFGDPIRNEKGWDKPELKAFGKISTGNTPPRNDPTNYEPSFIEWIKTDNIISDAVFLTRSIEHLSEVGARKARTVKSGALLIACIAGSVESIGRAALADRTVSFNQQINAIQPGRDVHPLYLYSLFKLCRTYVQSQATKGMKKILTKSDFEKITMIKPPLEIQTRFAVIVEKVEGTKSQYQQSLTGLQNLYGALSQHAFKGELDLSKWPMPNRQLEEEMSVAIELVHDQAEQSVPVDLADTDNLLDAVQNVEARRMLISRLLEAYRSQLGSTSFSVPRFMETAQTKLAESHPHSDFELGVDDYEHIKTWVFEALASHKITQAFDDVTNQIQLKGAQA